MSETPSFHVMLCPVCKGAADVGTVFMCARPRSQSTVEKLTCPFCLGAGQVGTARHLWWVIGARLRAWRESRRVGVVGNLRRQRLQTLDRDCELVPLPLDIAAHLLGVAASELAAIEAGDASPFSITDRVISAWSAGVQCGFVDCREPEIALCDFPESDAKTCDRPICKRHRVSRGRNVDWCVTHVTGSGTP